MNYAEHAIADFKEMKEHGCDTVILAITGGAGDDWACRRPECMTLWDNIGRNYKRVQKK